MVDAAKRPYKPVRPEYIDDWTGTKFVKECYGPKNCAPPPFVKYYAEKLTKDGKSTGKPLYKKEKKDKEETLLQLEPFDPNLADVDKIMKRYAAQDSKKELDEKDLAVENDKSGGLMKISKAS